MSQNCVAHWFPVLILLVNWIALVDAILPHFFFIASFSHYVSLTLSSTTSWDSSLSVWLALVPSAAPFLVMYFVSLANALTHAARKRNSVVSFLFASDCCDQSCYLGWTPLAYVDVMFGDHSFLFGRPLRFGGFDVYLGRLCFLASLQVC